MKRFTLSALLLFIDLQNVVSWAGKIKPAVAPPIPNYWTLEMLRQILMAGLILAGMIALLMYMKKNWKPHQIVESTLDAHDIRERIMHKLSPHGFVVTTQTDTSVTFQKTTSPSCLVGMVLLIFCVIPAIIYAIIGSGKIPLVVSVREVDAKRIVTITGPGYWVSQAKKSLISK